MANATSITNLQQQAAAPEAKMPSVRAGFFDLQSFELIQRVSKGFAASTLVPKEYQGNLSNCMIALNMAQRINADPMMVMQSLVVVHGRPTWSAQFLIATANSCGRFSAIRFEFFGEKDQDSWGCRAWAVEKETGEKLVGADVTIAIAKKEGWYGKNGSKWQSIPQQMLMYRAGSWWVRAYAPELSMGLQTADEAADTFTAATQPDGSYAVEISAMQSAGTAATNADTKATGNHAADVEDAVVVEPGQDQQQGTAEGQPQGHPQGTGQHDDFLAQMEAAEQAEHATKQQGQQGTSRTARKPLSME